LQVRIRKIVAAMACLAAVSGFLLAVQAWSSTATVRPAAAPVYKAATSKFPVIGADGPVLGVNLWAKQNYTAAQVAAYGVRMMAYIKNVLRASAVDIVWNFYATSYYGSDVQQTPSTLTAANVGILTQIARRYHLLIEYRPMMFVSGEFNDWEGMITPVNQSQWFLNYFNANLPYLRLAQKYRVSEFILGTELDGVSASTQWNSLLSKSAKVYQGQLSYADHDYLYFPPRTQYPPVSLLGLDMYEPLHLPATATSAQVTAGYEKYFAAVPAALLHRTAIDETGIQARDGAYAYPPLMFLPGTLAPEVQVNWFTAACESVKRYRMRGVFIWKVDLADNPAHPATSLSTFEGRPGARAIARCAALLKG
jgi:hypothetical protein